ncbi:MAG TPA: RES family NAD+ phosphorylase [Thermoanaerobaculia bacterium]|nr:RES family NAD+ phosphorylase [Thermoanaerobaculia bacterium]
MPTGWRITKAARAATAFEGEGARLYGGRWNSPGTALVYTAESQSLAALELLVHLQASQLLTSYCSISATFDGELIEVIDRAALPRQWRRFPAPVELQEIGDRWAAARRSVVLEVPSAVVPAERLFLLNPSHSDFASVAIGSPVPFELDPRLK